MDAEAREISATVAGAAVERPALSRRRKLVFAAVLVVLVLVGLEGAARLFVHLAPNARWQTHQNLVNALGLPALNELLEPDEALFWRLKPNLSGVPIRGRLANSPELSFRVSTDARGFRRVSAPSTGGHSVVFLGDSCTFGLGVNDEQTFPALVQPQMPDVRCINAGVPGYSAYQGRRLLEELNLERPPDVVVIAFGFNDSRAWDDRSDLEHAELIAAERAHWTRHVRSIQLLRQLLATNEQPKSAGAEGKRPRLNEEEFGEQIRAMVAWCRARGSEPILLVWPRAVQMLQRYRDPKQWVVRRMARDEQVRIVDLVPVMRKHGQPELFLDAVHASPAGCALIAETLVPVLREALETARGATAQP